MDSAAPLVPVKVSCAYGVSDDARVVIRRDANPAPTLVAADCAIEAATSRSFAAVVRPPLSLSAPDPTAAAVASLLTPEARPLAATGFRDTTRVASGDPSLWTSILINNREAVSDHLRELILEAYGEFEERAAVAS